MADGIIMSHSDLSPSTLRHIQCAAARWITTFSPGNIADASLGDLIQGLKELQHFVECYVSETWGFQPLLIRLKDKLTTANAILVQPLEPYYEALDEIKVLVKRLRSDALDRDDDIRICNGAARAMSNHVAVPWIMPLSPSGIADTSVDDLIHRLQALRYFVECHITETWGFYPLLVSLKAELPVANTVLTQPLESYCQAVVEIRALQKQLRASAYHTASSWLQ